MGCVLRDEELFLIDFHLGVRDFTDARSAGLTKEQGKRKRESRKRLGTAKRREETVGETKKKGNGCKGK